mmetsp:Transcript_19078/g.52596  ORF Transcript_19078/g.52596 Transcript_19078/m.52596 type:complete len:201 (-) Transcript_19078:1352-1954(-)
MVFHSLQYGMPLIQHGRLMEPMTAVVVSGSLRVWDRPRAAAAANAALQSVGVVRVDPSQMNSVGPSTSSLRTTGSPAVADSGCNIAGGWIVGPVAGLERSTSASSNCTDGGKDQHTEAVTSLDDLFVRPCLGGRVLGPGASFTFGEETEALRGGAGRVVGGELESDWSERVSTMTVAAADPVRPSVLRLHLATFWTRFPP